MDMRNWVITHQNKITDFNEGSIAASLLEATAREIASLYNKTVSNIELYAENMVYAQFNFERKEGTASAGSVVFSRKAAGGTKVIIPEGTGISTDGGVKFITSMAGSIAAGGVNSLPVPAVCREADSIGNVRANTIKNIDNSIYGVDSVSNPTAFSGGLNQESDEEYRTRFVEFIIGLGQSSVSGIRAAGLSVNGVRSVSLVEHFPAENGYHFTLYAENGSGGLPSATKAMLEQVIIGNRSVDGIRAAGINARILAPAIVYVNIVIVFKVDGSIPAGLIEDAIKTNVTNYVNSLKIGEQYDKKTAYNMILKQPGVFDINTITPGSTSITKRQIIRLGSLSVEGV
jgi:uncharacterized phage protein gp47/JayE